MIRFGLVIAVLVVAACGGKGGAMDGSGGDTDGGDTDGPGSCEVEIQRTSLDAFASVWGDGQTVWATGYGIAVTGTAGAIADVSPGAFAYGDRVTGAEGRVFTAGWGELMEFADGEWIRHEGPQVLVRGLWAAAADEVWLVSEISPECEECSDPPLPHASRWDGTVWIEDSPPASAGLSDVWGVGANDLHVVGGDGVAFRRLDGEWIELATGTTSSLVRVRGNRADNVWALGSDGTVLHFDGAGWSAAASVSTDVWVETLWVGVDDTVYVLGEPTMDGEDGGDGPAVVMRLEADVWTPLGPPLEGQGLDLWGDDDALWVAGKTDGPVLHRIPLEDPSQATEQFHAQTLETCRCVRSGAAAQPTCGPEATTHRSATTRCARRAVHACCTSTVRLGPTWTRRRPSSHACTAMPSAWSPPRGAVCSYRRTGRGRRSPRRWTPTSRTS